MKIKCVSLIGRNYTEITVGREYEVVVGPLPYGEIRENYRVAGGPGGNAPYYLIIRNNDEVYWYPAECFEVIQKGKVKKMSINYEKVYKYCALKTEEFKKLNFKEEAQQIIEDAEKRKRLEILRNAGIAHDNYIVKMFSSIDNVNYGLYLGTNNQYMKPVPGAVFVATTNSKTGHAYPLKTPVICSNAGYGLYSIDVAARGQTAAHIYLSEMRPATLKEIKCMTEGQIEAAIKAGWIKPDEIKTEKKPRKKKEVTNPVAEPTSLTAEPAK